MRKVQRDWICMNKKCIMEDSNVVANVEEERKVNIEQREKRQGWILVALHSESASLLLNPSGNYQCAFSSTQSYKDVEGQSDFILHGAPNATYFASSD